MGVLTTYADYALSIAPDFLAEKLAILAGLGDGFDLLNQKVRRATRNVYLDRAEPAAYNDHGINSNMPRVRNETDDGFRLALLRRWEAWAQSGSRAEMLIQLRRLGYPSAIVVNYNDLWDVGRKGAFGGQYTSFWFLVLPWPVQTVRVIGAAKWGDGAKWGKKPGGPVWGGVGIPPDGLTDVRQVIYKWKPAHTSCRFIVVATSPTFKLNPDLTWPAMSSITYPVNEWWEFDKDGFVNPFYNLSPDAP